jgi:hypothetical protein
LEPVRPEVDDWLLDFIKTLVFSRRDFYETRDGGVRLSLKLPPFLAETFPASADKIKPVIEQVKGILLGT